MGKDLLKLFLLILSAVIAGGFMFLLIFAAFTIGW